MRIIRFHGGEIRSFDGDRVMGVFIGNTKRTNAVKSSLKIYWATEHLIEAEAYRRFKSVKNNNVKIRQACGIDVGESRAVRAGIRNNNDLIWTGSPPSFAARLSDCREFPHCTFISEGVYKKMSKEAKICDETDMWEKRMLQYAGEKETIYRSKYTWKP